MIGPTSLEQIKKYFLQTTSNPQPTSLWLERLEGRQLLAGDPLLIDLQGGAGSSEPADFTEVNGTAFFSANGGSEGRELWISDGTPDGTMLVKDIEPAGGSDPSSMVNMNGTLFFTANTASYGRELWISDGTSTGTQLVKDLQAGPTSSEVENLINANGTLFFTANDGSTGVELWKSDGTSIGTELVANLFKGMGSSSPSQLTEIDGTVYFTANDGCFGFELWRTDDSSAGVQLVKDLNPSFNSSAPEELTEVNGTLFFTADDGSVGREIWLTDGTSSGTVLLFNILPGSGSSDPHELTNVNGTLFFVADGGLYGPELNKSNGTSGGTQIVKDIFPSATGSYPESLTNVNGTLFFTADNATQGQELWKSDGTNPGTVLVKEINTSGDSDAIGLTNVDGTFYFLANDGSAGLELWTSDGTSGGTELVENINPGDADAFDSGDYHLANLNGTLFFSASDGSSGVELWVLTTTTPTPLIVTGTGPGSPSIVRVLGAGGSELRNFAPYTEAFTGGVRVATGDINGDGVLDIVTAAGPGGGPHIQVFDSSTGGLIEGSPNNFYAYAPNVTVGVFVAVGDVNDDGFDDIITSADAGGGPHIKVFSGEDGSVLTEFYAYDPNFTGGVRVAAGDVDGNGTAEIITAPGAGGGPHIRVFEGTTGMQMPGAATNFYAYAPNVLTGVYVASGDVDGDGKDDILTAPGAGGGPHVKVFSSEDASLLQNFYAYDPAFTGGVRIAAADLNQDTFADILTVPGPSGGPHTRAFSGVDLTELANFYSGSPAATEGLFIAGGISTVPAGNFEPMSAPLSSFFTAEASNPTETLNFETFNKKKSWFDTAEEFYSQPKEIDDLFSGLGIW
ncbi:Hypothetical protein PBC10988_25880 [Planctomycetales bacterium 10988]|nr:Hypothetical protein PBC10988_25880 [Planctomycetales bacterium 10988]